MTAANFSRILSPSQGVQFASSPALSNHVIDATNEGVAFAFDAQDTNAITHLGFRYGVRAGTPPTYIIGLEGLNASTGNPDGTYKTNGGNCSATFTPPADTSWDGTWQWVALSNSYTPSLGERLCITIRYSSGTIDASNDSSFTNTINNVGVLSSFPYSLTNSAGTWSKIATSPVYGVRTASSRYGRIVQGLYSTRSAATIGHRQAMKVNLPAGFGSTYKVAGIRACASLAATTGKTPLVKIWSASSALASKSFDVDMVASATSGAYRTMEAFFDTSVTLDFGTDYYFGFEVAETTSSGVLIYGTQYASSDDKASDDGGSYVSFATHNGTSWNDDATVRPWMELILEDWTEPTGGGGLILPMRVVSNSGRRR